MGPMYTSERAQYSKGYRAAELCRNLAEELGNDRGEDRDRFSAELSPSNQRLPWTPHGGQQPHGHCQLPWSRAASSRCLCSSSSPLAAARRVRSAGSTLIRELKEHRTFDCEELFPSDLRLEGRTQMVRVPNLNGRTSESAPCANAVFLPVRGPMFTLTTQPRKSVASALSTACSSSCRSEIANHL